MPPESTDDAVMLGVVEITAFAAEGDGIGRLEDGRVVFVAGAVPGDRVELADVQPKKRFVRARIGRLVEESPARTTPRCRHFGECGGCLWQHVEYDTQLEAKRKRVADALERIGGLAVEGKIDLVPSPSSYAYRGRARFVECESGVGYRTRGGPGARAVDVCPVLVPDAEARLVERGEAVRDAPAKAPPRKGGRTRDWIVTTGSGGDAIVTPSGARMGKRRDPAAPRAVTIEVASESLRVSGESFVQGNMLLWDTLVAAVRDACLGRDEPETRPTRFVELYAGAGFFTLPLARAGLRGAALESERSALADLDHNLRRAGLSDSVEVLGGRVESRGDLSARLRDADVALVDPPRTGLDAPVRDALAAVGPHRLVYLSCDPGTLARDLVTLTAAGYALREVTAFDLFPQTPHIEALVVLEREERTR